MKKQPDKLSDITVVVRMFCINISWWTYPQQVSWQGDSQKLKLCICEEGVHEVLLSSQQPKAKDFRRHCCNVLFSHVRQQLTNKMKEDYQLAIQAIQHENVALQKAQLQICQDQIYDLINHHIPCANDPGKYKIVMIIEKNTTPEEDEFYEYPYYIARIQMVHYHKKTMI